MVMASPPEQEAVLAAPDVAPAPDRGWRRWAARLAWVPIPLLLVIIITLWAADLRTEYRSPFLAISLNFVTGTLASLGIVYLAGRSFLARGAPALLLLGCGAALWGSAGFVATAILAGDVNLGVTISNLGAWLSALCHLTGAVLSMRMKQTVRAAGLWLGTGYSLALGVVILLTLATFAGRFPVFFVQEHGGTPVRHLVLGSAIAMFVLAALLLRVANRTASSSFVHWYVFALLLIATGLFGAMIQSSRNTLQDWTCRAAQYVGGVYMLIAAFASLREPGESKITLRPAFGEMRYRDGVAIALPLAAAAVRIAFLQALGTRVTFVTFYPAVMLAALYGGLRAGLLATAASAILANLFITMPLGQFSLGQSADWLGLAVFLLSCIIISSITEAMHRARIGAREAQMMAQAAAARALDLEALRRKDAELTEAQRLAHIGSWYWDAKTDATIGSDEMLRIHGFDPATESMPALRDQKGLCYPVADWERMNRGVQETLQTGVGYELDVQAMRNGATIWLTTRSEAVRDADGRIVGVRGTVQDITARKLADAALRESEERLRLVLQASSMGTFEVDVLSGEERWNATEFELLGLKPGDAPAGPRNLLPLRPRRRCWGAAGKMGGGVTAWRTGRGVPHHTHRWRSALAGGQGAFRT